MNNLTEKDFERAEQIKDAMRESGIVVTCSVPGCERCKPKTKGDQMSEGEDPDILYGNKE